MKRCLALMWILLTLGMLLGCSTSEKTVKPDEWEVLEVTQPKVTPMDFPCTLSEGLLVAEKLVCYRGAYWEDGSGDPVEKVAGIMLYNPTNKLMEFAALALEQGGQTLYFFAHRIPPKSRCLVLEYEKKTCDPGLVTACRALRVRWSNQEFSREQVDYLGLGPTLTVINRDRRQLTHVTVWYKRYVAEGDYYLGGSAFSEHLYFLLPEERRLVTPEHYRAGSAKIVSIELKM